MFFKLFYILTNVRPCTNLGSKKGKFEAVSGHFCCEVVIHIYVFHQTGDTKTIVENRIVSRIYLST